MKIKKSIHHFFKQSSHYNNGMAIIMVTTSIALLLVILVEFTFTSKLNQIRVINQVDRLQAKLNAQAGLEFTLAKFEIYKEAWNKLENNPALKDSITISEIEALIIQGFTYPLPESKALNVIQKNEIKSFQENILLKGGLHVSIAAITHFLNPNNLIRTVRTQNNQQSTAGFEIIEKEFEEMLEKGIQEKIENDLNFATKYSNLDYNLMVKELAYYVNYPKYFIDDRKSDIENIYSIADVKGKTRTI